MPNRRQANTWTNDDYVHWSICVLIQPGSRSSHFLNRHRILSIEVNVHSLHWTTKLKFPAAGVFEILMKIAAVFHLVNEVNLQIIFRCNGPAVCPHGCASFARPFPFKSNSIQSQKKHEKRSVSFSETFSTTYILSICLIISTKKHIGRYLYNNEFECFLISVNHSC